MSLSFSATIFLLKQKKNVSKRKFQHVLVIYKLLCKQANEPIRPQTLLGLLRPLENYN